MAAQQKCDYYEVLGVPRAAGQDEIKSAYRKAALNWHPDRNPEKKQAAEERFREATEAYSVLSDPQKRSAYDRYGHSCVSGVSLDAGISSTLFAEVQDIFGDFYGFEDIFGGGRRGRSRSRARRGGDLRYDMTLTFEEAATGVTSKIKLPRQEFCEACKGTGAKAGTGMGACASGGGRGPGQLETGVFRLSAHRA